MNDTNNRLFPVLHPFFNGTKISKVAAGNGFSIVLTASGELYSFGTTTVSFKFSYKFREEVLD